MDYVDLMPHFVTTLYIYISTNNRHKTKVVIITDIDHGINLIKSVIQKLAINVMGQNIITIEQMYVLKMANYKVHTSVHNYNNI